jgi:two-component system, cell cycle sensor histidine kinase and response regulator CckA
MRKDRTSIQQKQTIKKWHPRTIGHKLTNPADSIQDIALRRKSQLLSIFLLILFTLFGLLDLTYYITIPGYLTALPDLGGYAFFMSAYVLNRNGRYHLASLLTVSTVPVVLFTAIVTDSTQNPIVTLNFLILGLLLSSILLSVRGTIFLAGITILGTLLMPLLAPAVIPNFTTILGPLATLLIGSALTVFSMIHRNQIESDRQTELRESEERFRAIYDGVNDAIFLYDAETYAILDVNKKMSELFGFSHEEATQLTLGENPIGGEFPFSAEEAKAWMETAVTTGTAFFEWHTRDKAGRQFWIEVNLKNTKIAQKDTILAVVRDITKRKQNEAAILQEKQFSEALLSTLPGIFYLYNSDLKLIQWNRNFEVVTGYSSEELRHQHILNTVSDEDKEKVEAAIHKVFTKGQASTEASIILKNGRQLPYFNTGVQLERPEGTFLLGVGINLTELKQTEEKLRYRNDELTLLNQIIATSVATLNIETILQIASDGLIQLFNMTQAVGVLLNNDKTELQIVAEHRPENLPSLLGLVIPIADNPLFKNLLTYKVPWAVEDTQNEPLLTSVKTLIQNWQTASLLNIPIIVDEVIVGGLSLGSEKSRSFSDQDIHLVQSLSKQIAGVIKRVKLEKERQEIEEQYRQSQKMEAIGQLTAGIAHDFNNLLTAINGFASLLQYKLNPDNLHQKHVEKILHAGQRAAALIRQLMAFSRKQIIEPKVLDINIVVTDLEKMLYRIIGEDVQLTTNLSENLWSIKVDPSQLEQIIINLAVNGRDAMPEGGRLLIETSNIVLDEEYAAHYLETRPGEYVQLAISDTGVGMSKEVKKRIFEPFFTTKEVGKGSGLGLATVFGIVKQGKGNIWVYSEEGKGTTFRIHLPRVYEPESFAAAIDSKIENLFGNETILLVEDDDEVRDLVRQVLQTYDYTVLMAREGRGALDIATNYKDAIHLLLTDVIMPGMNGKALAEKITMTRPNVKILFISGYSDEMIAHHGILNPGVNLLQKPFNTLDLAHKVREALDR